MLQPSSTLTQRTIYDYVAAVSSRQGRGTGPGSCADLMRDGGQAEARLVAKGGTRWTYPAVHLELLDSRHFPAPIVAVKVSRCRSRMSGNRRGCW